MPKIRSLAMTAAQVRALLREAEAPGSGMSRHAVPIKAQPNEECGFLVSSSISPQREGGPAGIVFADSNNWEAVTCREFFRCLYAPSDMIVCKETWFCGEYQFAPDAHDPPEPPEHALLYKADKPRNTAWKSPATMPRWASRLTLIVTDVRAQRLQDISDDDAIAMGAYERGRIGDDPMHDRWTMADKGWRYATPFEAYREDWDDRHGKRYPWDSNPWIWWLSFEVVARNVDDVVAEMANREVAT